MKRTSTRRPAASARTRGPAVAAAVLGALVAASPARGRVRAALPSPPRVRSDAPAPPWSGSRGAPPPPPLDRAGDGVRPHEPQRGHGAGAAAVRPEPRGGVGTDARPAAPRRSGRAGVHVVRRGDTLWSIAAAALGDDDPASVASYWPRIYAANRASIGDDPDVIVPGTRLVLPAWRS